MPELPEVETTVRGLARAMEGARLERVTVRRPDMRFPFPPTLSQSLQGALVTGLSRRAKYGLIHTTGGVGDGAGVGDRSPRAMTLIFHLGMSGRWRIDPNHLGAHDHLVIETASHVFALHDPRRFGFVDLVASAALDSWPRFAGLGPEPLGPQLTADYLKRALSGRRQPIKTLLLDQRLIAGLGNIYVCEALFGAGVRPTRAAGRVSRAALERLVAAIREVLEQAILEGGSSLRDYARPDGELGYFASRFCVYGREGLACVRCPDGRIRRIVQSGRSTWYCPRCQK